MKYGLALSEKIDKIFSKLSKKNKKQLGIIISKIWQIQDNPHHFKPLRGDVHGARRAHIDKSFVLIYEIDEVNKLIRVLDYDHHDKIY